MGGEAGVEGGDRQAKDTMKRMEERITVATLDAYAPVVEGTMIATVKIIPFAVSGAAVEEAIAAVPDTGLFAVKPYRPAKVGVVSTVLAGTSEKMLRKNARVLADRLARPVASVLEEVRVPYETEAVAPALSDLKARVADLLFVTAASAILPRGDLFPACLVPAGR